MGLFRRLRRKRLLRTKPSAEFDLGVASVRHLQTVDPSLQRQVASDARVFAAEKHWEGCAGLKVTDRMVGVVSALACLLVAGNHLTLYENTSSVLLYPKGYVAPKQTVAGGVIAEGMPRLGEAHFNGPVILSWADALRDATEPTGRNLVLHEFAHKLDMLDGMVNGTPPLPQSIPLDRWVRTMTDEYDALRRELETGSMPTLHPYAATNPGEFFAVATEHYFERPNELRFMRPALYDLLSDFYVVGG